VPVGAFAVIVLAFSAIFGAVLAPTTWASVTQFGSYGQGAGQFDEAYGVAVEQNSGDVYIVDRNNSRVEKWSGEGAFLEAWGWGVQNGEEKLQTCTTATGCRHGSGGGGAGQFLRPAGVAVDNSLGLSHGDVYVVDEENDRVQKFGPNGEFILMFGGEVNETKVREAEEGKSVTASEEDICTQVEIESGVECKAGVEGSADGEFEGLYNHGDLASIAVNADGRVYVGDAHSVQRFSEAGVYEATALEGAQIDALATAPGGDIYALGSEGAGVREYDEGGAEVGQPRDEAGAPETIAVGSGGSLFVDDDPTQGLAATHSIRAYNVAGEETQSFDEDEEDGANGIGWSEAAGALYVVGAEGGVRVRVLTLPPPGPVVVARSELARTVEPTTAVLDAKVNPEDQEGEGEYDFEYGTAPCTPGSCGNATPAGRKLAESFEGAPVEAPLSGLKPNTTYHFRVVATDSHGHRTVGPEATFTTLPAVGIEDTSVSDVAATSATFVAELDPLGVAATWRIEYAGKGAGLGTPEATIAGEGTLPAGSGPFTVSAHAQTGLSAATPYYYRVVATDEREGIAYTVEGPDETFTTQGEGEALGLGGLPDHRAWELVSPSGMHGAAIQPLNGSAPVQAAAGGGAIAYATIGAIEASIEGNRALEDSMVISTHGAEGWSSRDVAIANETVSEEGYKTGHGDEYRLFSSDLSTALVEPLGATPLPPLPSTAEQEQTLYLRHATGGFEPLVTVANVETGAHFGRALSFRDATSDLAHVVFASDVPLVNGKEAGLYEWSAGKLQFAGPGTLGAANEKNRRGAISSDGTRVFQSADDHLYMYDTATERGVQLDTVQPEATGFGSQDPVYQGTGAEGTMAFFTDTQELTPGASEGSLYAYDTETGALSDLTTPVNAGETVEVQGYMPGVSEDGSYAYVVAQGVLTTSANAYGETATAGAENLYELHLQGGSWQSTFIARLSSDDAPDWGGESEVDLSLTRLSARVSPNGRYLAFMSQRGLTGYDNEDTSSQHPGERPDEEVYLYDAQSAKLVCASCNPSGTRPAGIHDVTVDEASPLVDPLEGVWSGRWLAASVPSWTPNSTGEALYQSRYLDDSGRLFFDSSDALVPQAVNHTEDVYEYEPPVGSGGGPGSSPEPPPNDSCTTTSSTYSAASAGCVSLISSATSGQESEFLDASENGDDVFFLTAARLTPQAPSSGYSVYDAHVCGAGWACTSPQPVGVAPCESASECRAPSLSGTGADSTPASASFEGAGNLVPAPPPAVVKPLTRAQKLTDALRTCRRDKKKAKHKKCEKQARTKYGVAKTAKSTKGTKAKKSTKARS
jgi:hypothetical protein